jgi:phosphohistidine phosphatase
MRLYLVRHGIAEPATTGSDAERPLTPKGKLRMAEAAKGLLALKVRLELILTSPIRRAKETATILAQGMGGIRLEELPELAQGFSSPADVLAALHPYKNLAEIALVGHQPSLGELASFMLTGSANDCEIDFKKGTVACFEQESPPRQERFALIWSLPPKVLRSL